MNLKHDRNAILTIMKSASDTYHEDLINLFCNFFYENPFKPSFDQEELIEVIFYLLEAEIGSLKTKSPNSFLDNNLVAGLLKGFSRRQDIKSYLSLVLGEIILDMDKMPQQFISMELSRINEIVKEKHGSKKRLRFDTYEVPIYLCDNLSHSQLTIDNSESNSIKQMSELLLPPEIINVDEYIKSSNSRLNPEYVIELEENEIDRRVQMSTDDPFMKEFYQKQLDRIKKERSSFTNTEFCKELSLYKDDWFNILMEYKKNFEKMKFFIDKLICNLLETENIIPYTIKVICKIIESLLFKKFPDITLVEKNAFIAEFIIAKLIMPIMTNPDYNGIIASSIISQETRKNLVYLTRIIKKVFRGNFFDSKLETFYTIFNTYFCEILPYVNKFIEKLTLIKLNGKIEEMIDASVLNPLTKSTNTNTSTTDNNCVSVLSTESSIQYPFPSNNTTDTEVFIHQSLCLTFDEILLLYNIMKTNQSNFFKTGSNDSPLKTLFEKMQTNESDILSQKENRKEEKKEYLIISRNTFSKAVNAQLESKTVKFSFTETDIPNQSNDEAFVLARVKFCIKTILRSLNNLNLQYNPNLEHSVSALDFFNKLSKVIQLEDYSNRITNDQIPLGWYSLYLQTNLSLLNKMYIDNDYYLLYNEIDKELKASISELQNTALITQMEDKIAYSNKINDLIEKDYLKTKQFEKYIRIYLLTHTKKIPVSMKLNPSDQTKIRLKKTLKKNSPSLFETINDFTSKLKTFPQVKEDIRSSNQPNKVNDILSLYLSFVHEFIQSDPLFVNYQSESEINEIVTDVENQIVDNMYDYLYPKEQNKDDNKFFLKCKELAKTITPVDLEIKQKYKNEKLWSIAICYLNRIDIERTPINKINCIQSAYKIVNNCISFSAGKNDDAGVDDILPIFIYIIIKAKPQWMFTNLNYIKALIHPDKLINTYGFILMQIEIATNYIETLILNQKKKDKTSNN